MAGKGDRYRPVNQKKWDEGYERAFGIKYWMKSNSKKKRKIMLSGDATMIPVRQPEFQGFPKISRLNRDIIITEKIDGTNAQVLITEDGRVFPGSRKHWLTIENDNFGFAAWVKDHEDELQKLGPGRHFGEWWGRGIQRGYGLDHKRFSLFNVSRWYDLDSLRGISQFFRNKERQDVPSCCHVVPILAIDIRLDFHYIEHVLEKLRQHGSLAAPGFMQPEGAIIFHTASNYLFKVTLENDDKPKGK